MKTIHELIYDNLWLLLHSYSSEMYVITSRGPKMKFSRLCHLVALSVYDGYFPQKELSCMWVLDLLFELCSNSYLRFIKQKNKTKNVLKVWFLCNKLEIYENTCHITKSLFVFSNKAIQSDSLDKRKEKPRVIQVVKILASSFI